APVDLAGTDRPHDRAVCRRDVPDVRAEAVRGIERIGGEHVAVAGLLRDDRRGRDRGALLVTVDDGAVLGCGRPEPEAVDETDVGPLAGPQRRAQAAAGRLAP